MTTPIDILETAIDVINESGWQRHDAGPTDRSGPHCILGAICVSAREQLGGNFADEMTTQALEIWATTTDALVPLIQQRMPDDEQSTSAARWNDNFARGADDIVHLLKEAAESLR